MSTRFIPITAIMDRLLRNPLLKDLSYDLVIDYTVDFIEITGLPELKTEDNLFIGKIKDYKVKLPCEMTDESFVLINFVPAYPSSDSMITNLNKLTSTTNYQKHIQDKMIGIFHEPIYTYKVNGSYLFSNIECGDIIIQYDAIKTDHQGEPMIPNDRVFLKALELYIKYQYFTIKFEEGKLAPAILQNTEQEYCWAVGQLESKSKLVSPSEMASIMNSLTTLRNNRNAFDSRFGVLNSKERNRYFK